MVKKHMVRNCVVCMDIKRECIDNMQKMNAGEGRVIGIVKFDYKKEIKYNITVDR